jgi:acyl-coenzyme A synthetase/AMP-(fatty) acid ligase
MKMPRGDQSSIWNVVNAAGNLSACFLSEGDATVALSDLAGGSILRGRDEELRGRSVLIATIDQLTAALALIELDGIAQRLVLYPPDLPLEYVPFVMASAGVDAVVSDRPLPGTSPAPKGCFVMCSSTIESARFDRSARCQTEWVLLTSGTTGRPKMVAHNLSTLTGAIEAPVAPTSPVVWSTFYDIRRYGGLQIFLRTVINCGSMVLSDARASVATFLIRVGARKVTHISGTPSHWRRCLMSPSARCVAARYVRLSGEIADQSILNHLQFCYPKATVVHAFASTEAGVAFEVRDGLAGFPRNLLEQQNPDVQMKVQDGSLRIRSTRTATRYIGQERSVLADTDGFVDTGDILELRGDRYYFVGRRDGVINVGGQKVHPEEVEGVINSHPNVRMSLVRPRRSSITGALVVAEVVLKDGSDSTSEPAGKLEGEILQFCRQTLPAHKVPTAIHFVDSLALAETGKMARSYA